MSFRYSLKELFDLTQIQELLDDYHRSSGITVGLFDNEQRELAFAGWQPLCTKFHRAHPQTLVRCERSISCFPLGITEGRLPECRCENLLNNVAVPIIVSGERLGTLVIAQFLYDDRERVEEEFIKQAEEFNLDKEDYLAELAKVPRLSRAVVQSAVSHFSKLMQILTAHAQERHRLYTTIENSSDGFCLLEPVYDERGEPVDFVFQQANRRAAQVVGFAEHELKGKLWSSVFSALGLETVVSDCRVAFRRGENTEQECCLDAGPQTRQAKTWLQINFVSMRNEAALFLRDISKRKNSEEDLKKYANQLERSRDFIQTQARELYRNTKELKKARDEAEAAARSKSTFLASMSHEIRTPLTSIIGYAEIMLNDDLPALEQKNALRTLLRNSNHLLNLINDILDFSKIEAGKMESKKEPCLLMPLLYDVEAMMRAKAEEKDLQFSIDLRFPVPEQILSDNLRLKQILVNLVGNAVKFTEKGWVRIVVRSDAERELISFDIIDTGPGMTAEQQKLLFRPFSQVSEDLSKKHGGTGLGLAISRELAELLGGRIDLESSLRMGTVVSLTLPTGRLHDVRMLSSCRSAVSKSARDYANLKLTGRVLLVEDGKDNQNYLLHLLGKAGVEAVLAENGQQALSILEGESFDLVFMDMQMPVMDGYEATRLLRSRGEKVPIVALTAHAMEEHAEQCLIAGCSEHMGKPFRQEDFFLLLKRYLKDSRSVSGEQIVEERASESIFDDPEYHVFFEEFLRGLQGRIGELEAQFQSREWQAVKMNAHRIAGGAGLYGVRPLEQLARRLFDCVGKNKFEDAERVMRLLSGMCENIEHLSVLVERP